MGDRSGVYIRNDFNYWTFLYTHSNGNNLIENIRRGLKKQYDDYRTAHQHNGMKQASYIFAEMVRERGAYGHDIESHEFESVEEIYRDICVYKKHNDHRYVLIIEGLEISIFDILKQTFCRTPLQTFVGGLYTLKEFKDSKELIPLLQK